MSTDTVQLARQFYEAARALAFHRGTFQERLADAYADHLLAVSVHDLPVELQASFRELEQRMNTQTDDQDVDPIAAAANRLTDVEAKSIIETILVLYARVAASTVHS